MIYLFECLVPEQVGQQKKWMQKMKLVRKKSPTEPLKRGEKKDEKI